MSGYDNAPGFYGKVTTHGDFVTRRLPRSFIDAWDEWLQLGLQHSKQRMGNGWMNAYLTAPIWRFAVDSGVLDRQAWAGVVMPSVDRVGRHFPLTIAGPNFGHARTLEWLRSGNPWYENLEDLALGSLGEGFQLEQLESTLQNTPSITHILATGSLVPGRGPISGATCLGLNSFAQLGTALPGVTQELAQMALHGHTLWWTEGSEKIKPCLLICRGMPSPAQCGAMMDGNWQGGGWNFQQIG
ncbi:MAG: type VI secretion system-associated protein TagF [Burkholderiales bacterium]|nr:type VI secretion system-associated protein TagF [Burkholderiales bacterium]